LAVYAGLAVLEVLAILARMAFQTFPPAIYNAALSLNANINWTI
jgi:hypothetical protein